MNRPMRDILTLLLLGLIAATAQAQASIPFDWEKLEGVWNRAHLESDTAALDALWADDITIVVPGMAPLSKADSLKMWQSVPVKFTQYKSSGVSARVEGTVAVVTGRISRARTFGDRSADEQWYFTKVYRLANSAWRVIAFHASNAPD
nr:putative integron gene cassette protein [uncultured bacterium]